MTDSSLFIDKQFFDERLCLNELQDNACSKEELENIISSITWESPLSGSLFKGKYLIFILENLLSWQKPLGEYFHSTFAVCAVKPKKISESENNVCDESNYSGNPLLVQFEHIFQHNSDTHSHFGLKQLNLKYNLYPLPESVGRKLLSMCTAVKNSLKLPFVAICHGNNPKQHVLLGTYQEEKLIHLKIVNLGSVRSLENLPKMHNLKEAHLTGFNLQSYVKSNVTAHYDFLGYEVDDNSPLVPVKTAKLSFDCSWSGALSLLEPLPIDCICTAKINTNLGDDETGAFTKFKELKYLKALQQNLNKGEMAWLNTDSTGLVMDKINLLVDEEKSICRQELPNPNLDLDHIEGLILAERVKLYFTDKLWLIMKDCCSFDEMAKALTLTYKALTKFWNFQPCVHRKDISTISKDIINMIDKPIFCPDITPQNAGKLILEIGIEKMRKDYEQFFVGLELVSLDLFNNFVQHELLSSEAITSLEKLHSVLELAVICVKQLHLPKNILSEFVRSALRHYIETDKIDLQHVFHIHVPTIYALPLLTQMRPTLWELSLLSSDKEFLKQSIHRFVTTATQAHIYAPQNYHPKLMFEGASYVYLHGTLIVRSTSFF